VQESCRPCYNEQLLFLPEVVDDHAGPDNPVHFIEAFVDQPAGWAELFAKPINLTALPILRTGRPTQLMVDSAAFLEALNSPPGNRSQPRWTCHVPGSNASRAMKSPLRPIPRRGSASFFKTGAAFWMNIQARFDLETTEDVLAPQIKKIAPYEAA
jgi:hypothetical protein